MNNQASLREVEAIALDLPRSVDNLLLLLWRELRQVVAELPLVGAIRDHKSEPEAEFLDDSATEVVPLDHLQVLDWLGPNAELHRQADRLELEEIGAKMVLDHPLRRVVLFLQGSRVINLINGHIYEHNVGDHVTDAESLEGHLGPVVL